jgi:hypothetical protein
MGIGIMVHFSGLQSLFKQGGGQVQEFDAVLAGKVVKKAALCLRY